MNSLRGTGDDLKSVSAIPAPRAESYRRFRLGQCCAFEKSPEDISRESEALRVSTVMTVAGASA